MLIEAAGGYYFLDRIIPMPEEAPTGGEEDKGEDVAWEEPVYYEGIKQMVFTPTGARSNLLVQMSFALEVDSKAAADEIKTKHVILWDLMLQRIEAQPIKTVRNPLKKAVKADLIRAINAELRNGEVTAVYVTEMVMQ